MSLSTIDLSLYVRVGRFDLPEPTRTTAPANSVLAQEVSAVTYNWDTDTLFVVGDGGTSIVEISKTGQLIGSMTLATGDSPQGTEFYDPEGLAYIGGGKFVMTEERDRNAVQFTYAANTTLTRDNADTVGLGTNAGNAGLEGMTYDPQTGGFIFLKETSPQGIFQTDIDFEAGTATNGSPTTENSTNLFDPALMGLSDIADVYALSNLQTLTGSDTGNLLVLSQEDGRIIEVDRDGNILSTLHLTSDPDNPLSLASQQHEGLAMDFDGFLYVVSENGGGDFDHPQLWVFAPSSVPNEAPTALALNNQTASLAENASTATRVKVADVSVTDDGLGTNNLTVTGADASFFEVDNTGLYIKAGTVLDFETKTSYSVTVNVDDAAAGTTPDASASYTLTLTDVAVETPAVPTIYISEVAPWSSGNSPVGVDWFEVTNSSSAAVDITGWRMDDSSNSFGSSLVLNGITNIGAGESVIFFETANLATTQAAFIDTWFGGVAPAGLRFGSYSGGGAGLSTGGDSVVLFNSAGAVQAAVSFGASPINAPFATFDNSAGLNDAEITQTSQVGLHEAFAAANDPAEIGSPGSVGDLFISEVAPWSSGDSPVGADWFEITNTSAFAIDITGWKVDDSSGSPAAAVALTGITSIGAGESVIFIETSDLPAARTAFINTWFGGVAPVGLHIGGYSGAGIGLSTGGDALHLYNSTNVLQASVTFGASTSGPFATFDNAAGLDSATISELSTVGVNGGFVAAADTDAVGSPGSIFDVTNDAPTAVALTDQVSSIVENSSTATRVKVANVAVVDDGLGTNTLALIGADAAFFEVDATGLYIKAGTALDFETKSSYAVTVTVDDTAIGTTPDASTAFTLTVTDVANEGAPSLYISEVAPWSSGDSPVGADWFEVTNRGSSAIDITGWKMDDSSNAFGSSVALSGITSIGAGESVIFFETGNLAAASAAFIDLWFDGVAPAGLRFGSYSGGGVGLSTSGDAVYLFNAAGARQAGVTFGASPTDPFATFDNSGALNNTAITDLSTVGVHGAAAAANDKAEIGSPGTVGKLFISEVAPWSSGDSPVGADWFEVTNTSAFAIDISGWKVDDSSNSFASAIALSGITSIGAGESVIFIETSNLTGARATFINTWFGGNAPAGLQIGGYSGSGIGLSTGGDAVNLFDSAGVLKASVSFGASTGGPFATFDNSNGLDNAMITQISADGVHGAFAATNDPDATGSPGGITNVAGVSIFGTQGDDTIDATQTAAGQPLPTNQDDRINGRGGADTINGLGGNDILNGGADADTMSGGSGSDRYFVDDAGDTVIEIAGQGGADMVITSVSYTLDAGQSIERLRAGTDASGLTLGGNELGNTILGGDGNDTIVGGGGLDVLLGGDGSDTFVFESLADSGASVATRDRIKDFTVGADLIDLSAIDADTGAAGNSDFNFVGSGRFENAGDLRVFAAGANTMIAGDVNGDRVADFQILLLGSHTLTAADFML
jgi:uncharacterized protein YjiK